jgi:hypothetical protein
MIDRATLPATSLAAHTRVVAGNQKPRKDANKTVPRENASRKNDIAVETRLAASQTVATHHPGDRYFVSGL